MSAARANRPEATGRRGRATHQNKMDKILREHNYEFLRVDSHLHNIYVNEHGQRVTVPCSPKSSGNSQRMMMQDIARQARERNGMTTTPTVNPADQLIAMADSFLLTQPSDKNGRGAKARHSALQGWIKRVLERHGPIASATLTEAGERMGFARTTLQAARDGVGVVSFNAGGTPSKWMVCLPYQLPEGFNARKTIKSITAMGVSVEAPEPKPVETPTTATNGTKPLSDQQQAFLLMAESLGMELPDNSGLAKGLDAVIAEFEHALANLKHTREALGG